RAPLHRAHPEGGGGGRRRRPAVDVALEEAQDLRAAPLPPVLKSGDRPAVLQRQGVGQRVGGDLRLVVVEAGRPLGGGQAGGEQQRGQREGACAGERHGRRISGEGREVGRLQHTPAVGGRSSASARRHETLG